MLPSSRSNKIEADTVGDVCRSAHRQTWKDLQRLESVRQGALASERARSEAGDSWQRQVYGARDMEHGTYCLRDRDQFGWIQRTEVWDRKRGGWFDSTPEFRNVVGSWKTSTPSDGEPLNESNTQVIATNQAVGMISRLSWIPLLISLIGEAEWSINTVQRGRSKISMTFAQCQRNACSLHNNILWRRNKKTPAISFP